VLQFFVYIAVHAWAKSKTQGHTSRLNSVYSQMQVAVNAFHGLAEGKIPSLDKKLGNVCTVFLPYSSVAVTWTASPAVSPRFRVRC
jgi:hypothetical protein